MESIWLGDVLADLGDGQALVPVEAFWNLYGTFFQKIGSGPNGAL